MDVPAAGRFIPLWYHDQMFDVGLNADQLDHLAMLFAFALLFLFGAGVRVRFDRLRFSLRTLLIFTTMVGLVLGAVVWAAK